MHLLFLATSTKSVQYHSLAIAYKLRCLDISGYIPEELKVQFLSQMLRNKLNMARYIFHS